MAECVNDGDILRATQGAAYDPSAATVHTTAPTAERVINTEVNAIRARRDWDRIMQQLDELGNPDDRGTIPPTNAEVAQANQLGAQVQRAIKGIDAREQFRADLAQQLGNIAVQERTGWMKLSTWVDHTFNDKMAPFYEYCARYAPQLDRALVDNAVVKAFSAMSTKIAAERNAMYKAYIEPLVDAARPIAKRIGQDEQFVLECAGRYANTLHAPEANAHLRNGWSERIAEINEMERIERMADPEYELPNDLQLERGRLSKWIDDLDEALNNPYDVDPTTVKSYGILDWEVPDIQEAIFKTGITKEELDGLASTMTEICQGEKGIRNRLFDAGIFMPEEAANQPDFQHYVPAITKGQLRSGVLNDSGLFNPGSFYAREGRLGGQLADGFTAILNYIDRSAKNIGSTEAFDALYALAHIHRQQGINGGIKILDYRQTLTQAMTAEDVAMRRAAERYLDNGGLVGRAIEQGPDGQTTSKQVIIAFDPNWMDPAHTGDKKYTGAMLNDAIAAPTQEIGPIRSMITKATSLQGRLYTQLRPLFAPVAMQRDFLERMFDMAGSTYVTEGGERIHGASIAMKMLFNAPNNAMNWFSHYMGYAQEGSRAAQYGAEFDRLGLRQSYIRLTFDQGKPDTLAQALSGTMLPAGRDKNMSWLTQAVRNVKQGGSTIMSGLEKWNDFFQNAAAFNEYCILRNAGVSESGARDAVLRFMNLRAEGTQTANLRVLYPFVNPTIKSAASTLRTLGFSYDPRGFFHVDRLKTYGFVLGSLVAGEAIKDVATAMLGQDENGNNRIDGFTASKLSTGIPFPVGDGSYAWLNTGYGLPNIALSFVWNKDRMQRGLITPGEMAAEVLFTGVKNSAPGNFPEFDFKDNPTNFLLQTFVPSIILPFVQQGMNMDRYGRSIHTSSLRSDRPASDQGGVRASRVYHQWAKTIYDYTGMQYTPEDVQHIVQSYLGGPLRMLRAAWESDSEGRALTERSKELSLHPLIEAFGGSMHGGKLRDPAASMFFTAKDKFDNQLKRDRINLKDHDKKLKGDALVEFKRQKLLDAGWSPENVEDYLLIEGVVNGLNGKTTEINKKLRADWLSEDDSSVLMNDLNEYENGRFAEYAKAVRQMNLYK